MVIHIKDGTVFYRMTTYYYHIYIERETLRLDLIHDVKRTLCFDGMKKVLEQCKTMFSGVDYLELKKLIFRRI